MFDNLSKVVSGADLTDLASLGTQLTSAHSPLIYVPNYYRF